MQKCIEIEAEEKEILREYRKLIPENRINALSNLQIAYTAQENTKGQYGLLPGSIPAKAQQAQTGTGV